MATVTDLRRILNLKRLIILFVVNLFNDIIPISLFLSLKETAVTQNGLYYLFDRYFCTNIGILAFAQFISFYGFIVFCVVDRIREDNQKYGIFYLVRYSRLHYVFGKFASSVIFLFFVCAFSTAQSYLSHRLMRITVSGEQYTTILALSFLIAFSGAQTALFVYSLLNNPNLSFLCFAAILTAFSVIFSVKKLTVPTPNNIPIEYIYPFILALALTVLNFLVMFKNDFITTKIKE
ncbi:MAG: hypothetical protein ACOX45_07395 [Acutalibacteraceae bacterium]